MLLIPYQCSMTASKIICTNIVIDKDIPLWAINFLPQYIKVELSDTYLHLQIFMTNFGVEKVHRFIAEG